MAEVVFPGKFLFALKNGFSYFGEIPFNQIRKYSFSQSWLIIFFWFFAQWCKMAMPKMCRSPIFEKKYIWANLGQKLPKNRVFWTLCKILSLLFSDFLYKDGGQDSLKNGWSGFSRKILIRLKKRIFVFWGNSL